MIDLEGIIRQRVYDSIRVKKRLLQGDLIKVVAQVGGVLVEAYRGGNKVILFGNGGSAADAQHIAAELIGRYYLNRAALPAIALTTNSSSLTAVANDYSFDLIFARQLEAMAAHGDVAVGISTSGNSENVVQALRSAKEKGVVTVGLTGEEGGEVKSIVDYCICVPCKETPRIQECHILLGHILCEIIERSIFGDLRI